MTLQKFITLGALLSLLFLSGCGAEKKAVPTPQKTLPAWYASPPLSNGSELYALGEGKSKEEAIANALSLMASTLSVSISSSYNAKTIVREGRVNSAEGVYASEVQSDVKKIRIGNYELLNAESLGFKKYAVLLKSNKKKLFESMLQETRQEFEIIEQKERSVANANGLKKLALYKNAKTSLENLPNTLIVMSALNPAFDGSSYLETMQDINAKHEAALANLSFSIETDTNAANLKAPLAKALSAKKLTIKNAGSKPRFRVYVTSQIERADAYGFTLARSAISIVTKDSSGSVVGSNSLNITGQSSQGFAIAKQNVALKLDALIEKEGIAKIMGLDI